jgi:hypothetical protein
MPRRVALFTALVLIVSGFASKPAFALPTNVTCKVEASVKETYDSNVYLQDKAPTNHIPGAVSAGKGSFVTTISPKLSLDYAACPAFKVTLSYAPDITWYASAPSEDNTTHRWGVNLGGAMDKTAWDLQNTFTYIIGSDEGPIFARPQDIPPIGGIPLRDRRAAFIYRSNFKLTQTSGKWMFRPVVSAYVHDFKTDLRPSPSPSVYTYENYIDRQDINGGLDIGYEVVKHLRILAGYRYGRQDHQQSLRQYVPTLSLRRGRRTARLAETLHPRRTGLPPVR